MPRDRRDGFSTEFLLWATAGLFVSALEGLRFHRVRSLHLVAAITVGTMTGIISAHVGQESFAPIAAIIGFIAYFVALLAVRARYT